MQEQYHKWYSQYLSRDLEMLVFGNGGTPLILFPTENGRYFDAKDFGIIKSISNYIDEGKIKIYCPDSFDSESWYNYYIPANERVKKHLVFEKSILNDVIEFAKFDSQRETVGLSGISFGCYHALNIALKYPVKVNSILTLGGFFNIKRFILGHYDDDCYFNNPVDFMPNLNDEWYLEKLKKMKIVFAVGEDDPNKNENIEMHGIFDLKHINNTLKVFPGFGHDWNWWAKMFYDCLPNIY